MATAETIAFRVNVLYVGRKVMQTSMCDILAPGSRKITVPQAERSSELDVWRLSLREREIYSRNYCLAERYYYRRVSIASTGLKILQRASNVICIQAPSCDQVDEIRKFLCACCK